jgi:hypothetical protein
MTRSPAGGGIPGLTPRTRRRSLRLDVHCLHILSILVASRHSRASGNPGGKSYGAWMPVCAGMTFDWRWTCATGI